MCLLKHMIWRLTDIQTHVHLFTGVRFFTKERTNPTMNSNNVQTSEYLYVELKMNLTKYKQVKIIHKQNILIKIALFTTLHN